MIRLSTTFKLSFAQFIEEQIEPFHVYIVVDWHLWLVYLSFAAKIIVSSDAHAQRAEMEPIEPRQSRKFTALNHASTSFSSSFSSQPQKEL